MGKDLIGKRVRVQIGGDPPPPDDAVVGEELADRGHVSPFMGMWAPNILLVSLGIIMMWQIQPENRVWRLDILDVFRKKVEGNSQ